MTLPFESYYQSCLESLNELASIETKHGGFLPSIDKELPSAWCSAVMLLIHRHYAYLSPEKIDNLLRFLITSFCKGKKRNNKIAYGWGSFSDASNKEPIPVITATVLLALCGIQHIDKRLEKMFEMGLLWLLGTQKTNGVWSICAENDYYSNLSILLVLRESQHLYNKSNTLFSDAISACLARARTYYGSIEENSVVVHTIKLVLEVPSQLYKESYCKEFTPDYTLPNHTPGRENFSFHKYSIVIALSYLALSRKGAIDYADETESILSTIYDKRDGNLLWSDAQKTCYWLSSEIVLATILLYNHSLEQTKSSHRLYHGACVCKFSLPPWVKVVLWVKLLIKLGRTLSSARNLANNWLSASS